MELERGVPGGHPKRAGMPTGVSACRHEGADAMKKKANAKVTRLQALREMLSDYRRMTIEEVDATGWGDRQIELEGEVWRLEQELREQNRCHPEAA